MKEGEKIDKYYHMIVSSSEKAGFIADNLNIEYLNKGLNDYTACWVCSTDVPIEMVTYMGRAYYFDDVSEAKDFYKKAVLKFNNNKRCYYNKDLRNNLIASRSTMNIKFSAYSFDFGTLEEKKLSELFDTFISCCIVHEKACWIENKIIETSIL